MQTETLREGLITQTRVMHALLLREIRTRFGQHRIGYAWSIIEPTTHILILFALRSIFSHFTHSSIPIFLWLISGIVPMLMFRNTVSRVVGAVRGNRDALIMPQVKILDIIVARSLLELATFSLLLLTFLICYTSIVGPVHIHDPLRLLFCLLTLVLLGMGFGMLCLVITSYFPSTQVLVGGILRFLYFISGVFFAASNLPHDLLAYATWNPLLHVFENLHAAFFEVYTPLPAASDLSYALSFAMLMNILGILLIKRSHRVIMEP